MWVGVIWILAVTCGWVGWLCVWRVWGLMGWGFGFASAGFGLCGIWLLEFGFCGLALYSYWRCRSWCILCCLGWVRLDGFGVLNLVCGVLDVGG